MDRHRRNNLISNAHPLDVRQAFMHYAPPAKVDRALYCETGAFRQRLCCTASSLGGHHDHSPTSSTILCYRITGFDMTREQLTVLTLNVDIIRWIFLVHQHGPFHVRIEALSLSVSLPILRVLFTIDYVQYAFEQDYVYLPFNGEADRIDCVNSGRINP